MGVSLTDRILRDFGRAALKYSALNFADGEKMLRLAVGDRRPSRAIEIGTYKGASAACLAQLCRHVTTIDLRHGLLEDHGIAWDRRAFWKALGIDNIDLHLVDDDADKARLVDSMQFDFAFIDGAHDKTVARDFALVKRCGAVLFHDYNGERRDHVSSFVNSLRGGQLKTFPPTSFALWTEHG